MLLCRSASISFLTSSPNFSVQNVIKYSGILNICEQDFDVLFFVSLVFTTIFMYSREYRAFSSLFSSKFCFFHLKRVDESIPYSFATLFTSCLALLSATTFLLNSFVNFLYPIFFHHLSVDCYIPACQTVMTFTAYLNTSVLH